MPTQRAQSQFSVALLEKWVVSIGGTLQRGLDAPGPTVEWGGSVGVSRLTKTRKVTVVIRKCLVGGRSGVLYFY